MSAASKVKTISEGLPIPVAGYELTHGRRWDNQAYCVSIAPNERVMNLVGEKAYWDKAAEFLEAVAKKAENAFTETVAPRIESSSGTTRISVGAGIAHAIRKEPDGLKLELINRSGPHIYASDEDRDWDQLSLEASGIEKGIEETFLKGMERIVPEAVRDAEVNFKNEHTDDLAVRGESFDLIVAAIGKTGTAKKLNKDDINELARAMQNMQAQVGG